MSLLIDEYELIEESKNYSLERNAIFRSLDGGDKWNIWVVRTE